MQSKISAIIITKNEEQNISRCIRSLKSVADEILIIDSGSEDQTLYIAATEGAQIIQTKWLGYAATKNLGNQKAANDFVLSIDADEELSAELIKSILRVKKNGLTGTYSFNRRTNYCGTWISHLGWYPDVKIRIFNKLNINWIGDFVHEDLAIPESTPNTHLNGDLNHYSYTSAEDHRKRADHYSSLTAQKMHAQGKTAHFFQPWASSITRFLKMYIMKLGFLDGSAGLRISRISAISNSFKYKELIRISKKEKLRSKLKHVCISRVDSIGDVMLTFPLMGVLKENFPDVTISFLGKNYTEALAKACSSIDHFISLDDLDKLNSTEQISFIQKKKFSTVIHVLHHKELASLFHKASVPIRLGSRRKWYNIIHCNYWVNYSRRKSNLHESQLNLKMLERLYCNTNISLHHVANYYSFKAKNITYPELQSSRKKIILHPKSQGSAPEWATANFNELSQILATEGFQVYITGTEKEGKEVRPYFDFSESIIDCTGKFSLEEYISFINECDLLIAASTGPVHISAALGKTTLGLYTSQRPAWAKRWGPLGKKATAISSNAQEGLLTVSVTEVSVKTLELLAGV